MKKWILAIYLISLLVASFIATGFLLPPPKIEHKFNPRFTPTIPLIPPPREEGLNYEAMLEKPGPTPAFPGWKPGPLKDAKHEIVRNLEPKLETGDVLFRSSNALAANGIAFSQYVERFSESDFSHASIILKNDDKIYVLEIDDLGVHLYNFLNWLDTPCNPDFAVYKPKNATPEFLRCVKREIDRTLVEKPEYDFLFNDPNKLYCVESVAEIYLNCGIKLCQPKTVREVMSPLSFMIFKPINQRMIDEDGQGLPTDEPLWFVGNEKHGLMSSEHLYKFYRHNEQ